MNGVHLVVREKWGKEPLSAEKYGKSLNQVLKEIRSILITICEARSKGMGMNVSQMESVFERRNSVSGAPDGAAVTRLTTCHAEPYSGRYQYLDNIMALAVQKYI